MTGLLEPTLAAATDLRPRRGIRAVASFPVFLGALLIVMMMFTIRSRFSDPDMWWHLKNGEVIWSTHSIPRVDLFSFTAQGHPWIAQEWLSELTMYAAFKLGGYSGLMMWFAVLACLLIIGAYVLCTLYGGNCKVAFLGGVTVWLFSTVGLAPRPHLIGYVLLITELLLIHLGRTRHARWFWGLPPLFALWINFHSSYFLGLVVLGALVALSFVQFRIGLLESTRWLASKRKTLAMAFGLSIAALFLNPIGFGPIWYPINIVFSGPVNMSVIQEWQQPAATDPRTIALLAVGAFLLAIPLLRRICVEADELVFAGLGFGFALQHQRMFFIFGILAAPVLCRLLATAWERYDPRRDSVIANAVMVTLVLLIIPRAFPSAKNLQDQVDRTNPVDAVKFLKRSGLSGNMLNEYIFGGYLIWAAPEHQVFVDGRSDVFEWTGVLADYKKWLFLEGNPADVLEKYHVQICLLARNAPQNVLLALLPTWHQVYSDNQAVIYARDKRN